MIVKMSITKVERHVKYVEMCQAEYEQLLQEAEYLSEQEFDDLIGDFMTDRTAIDGEWQDTEIEISKGQPDE